MIEALVEATRSQFQGRMLGLVLWPLLGSLLLWTVLLVVFWSQGMGALRALTEYQPVDAFLNDWGLSWLVGALTLIVSFFFLPTLVAATAIFITSVFAMPMMVDHIAARDYPQLVRAKGGTTSGSILNSLGALLVYLLLWILVLPLWLILPFAFVIPVALAGYLNDRVFRYDALAEHATREEYEEILRRHGSPLFGLGVVAALVQLIPFVNLISPVYSGLSFIHFALAELQKLRAERPLGLRPAASAS
ncbi:EI24 domain-containing protein [Nevskia ramosa]|uniref:EI24 domain-containing protein n=2 Tax=Nevskia ramosa TaxID=64002 RepID=UPI0003B5B2E4|nr:EI24 domain-containing protein [Nevskia ramosa]